jgi:hypothetical protein
MLLTRATVLAGLLMKVRALRRTCMPQSLLPERCCGTCTYNVNSVQVSVAAPLFAGISGTMKKIGPLVRRPPGAPIAAVKNTAHLVGGSTHQSFGAGQARSLKVRANAVSKRPLSDPLLMHPHLGEHPVWVTTDQSCVSWVEVNPIWSTIIGASGNKIALRIQHEEVNLRIMQQQ